MSITKILIGISVGALGLLAMKNPNSWWFRTKDDTIEQRKRNVSFLGNLLLTLGVIMVMFGVQSP